jgi:hypothetical protein
MEDEYKWWWWWRHYGFQLSSVEMERGLESLIETVPYFYSLAILTGPASFKFEKSTCQENHSFFQELL